MSEEASPPTEADPPATAETEPPAAAETAKPSARPAEIPVTAGREVASLALGFAAAALVDALVLLSRPYARAPFGVRALAHFYSAGFHLALGAALAAGLAAWRRFGPRSRRAGYVVIAAVSWALGYLFYGVDLSGMADAISRSLPVHELRMAVLTLGLSLSVPIAVFVVGQLVLRWHWAVGLALAVVAAIGNGVDHEYPQMHLFISQSYPGVHLLVAVLAGVLAGLSFERAPLPAWLTSLPGVKRAALGATGAAWGSVAMFVLPSNSVLLELQRYPGAVLFPFVGRLHAGVRGTPNVPADKAAWFTDRRALPPIPATKPALIPGGSIVILVGIDSMRADLLTDEKYREDLPELFRLRDESVYFSHARAGGSSTAPSLAAMFSGVYYSQLYWSVTSLMSTSLVYPEHDTTVRFPEVLTRHGVRTMNSEGTGWLTNDYGIARGFVEEKTFRRGDYGHAEALFNALLPRLRKPELDPQFYFVHTLDAHSPYTSAGKRTSEFLGYLAEVSRVDRQIKRLNKALAQKKLLDRTVLIIYSDHGEAFGEHGTYRHAVSLYEELVRVPLLISVPGLAPRTVHDDVSLMDIGPTVLDLFGLPTPAHNMGESLTGYLRGQSPALTRPIVSEARLKHAMILPGNVKVIYDTKTHVAEIYDLNADPKEERNLYRDGDPVSAQRLGVLTAFYDVHTLKKPGYEVPYRKW